MLCAVLLLQLALGMPGSSVLAAIAPAAAEMSHDGGEPCPEHGMVLDHAGLNATTHHAAHSGRHAPSNHGCCQGGACQCHCTYPPAVSAQPSLAAPVAVFTHRLPASPAPFIAAPSSERFRPPIA
jgi:hypothetical protein